MIPVEMKLKNFLSYGEEVPPLDFTQFHVACLSGANGQGKSALLEALAWAIWGEGRKGNQERKADSSLLRLGKDNMMVDIIFDLEKDRYRIIRTFAKSGKSTKSGLEFQTYNQKESKYVSLTATSTRLTQEKINKIIRLDYQTFINSAFIMQGKANEFSQKTARERKEVLSEILGLSSYDDMADLAKVHLREINNIITAKDSRLEYIAQELEQIKFYESRIKELTEDYTRATKEITEKEGQVTKLKEELNTLRNKSERAGELTRALEQQRREIYQKKQEIDSKKEEIADCEKIIFQKESILTRFTDYQRLNTENNELTSKLRETRKVEEQKLLIERKIESEKSNLVVEFRSKEDKYRDLKVKADQGEKSKAELTNLETKIAELKSLEEECENLQDDINKYRITLNNTENKIEVLERDNNNNKEKISLLTENPEGKCPLCEAELNSDRQKKIEANLNKEIDQNTTEIMTLGEETIVLKKGKIVHSLDRQNELKYQLQNKNVWQQKLSKVQLECKESEQASKLLAGLKEEIEGIKKVLEEKNYALEEHKRLAELEGQIKSMGYNESRHYQVNNEQEKLHDAPANKLKLEEAEKKFDSLKETLLRWQKDYEEKRLNIETQEKNIQEINKGLEGIFALRDKLAQEEESLKRDLTHKDDITLERGRYQSKYEQCLKLQEEKTKMESELESSYKDKKLYEKLIVAFGKNGIQALIIENSLPEIEDEANKLLAKLTSNGTSISMESLKDLKSGRLKETLEIKISDELGVRDYELYSGGEAFRIDFSLRIALSKLLARRAGTKLRTLIIDEGFGTQDEEGLENIVEAIRSISDDFDKILVITHLETLKNAFPVKIEITKYPETGSQYRVIKN